MMSCGLHDERLVDHEVRTSEARVEIAEGPFLDRLAHRHAAFGCLSEVGFCPLQSLARGRRRRLARRCRHGRAPHVAVGARVGTVGAQAVQWIDDEGEGLEIDVDELDRIRGDLLADGSDRKNRFTTVQWLVRETALGAAQFRDVIGG